MDKPDLTNSGGVSGIEARSITSKYEAFRLAFNRLPEQERKRIIQGWLDAIKKAENPYNALPSAWSFDK